MAPMDDVYRRDEDDAGLAHDLRVIAERSMERRHFLRVAAGMGLATLVPLGCKAETKSGSVADAATGGDGGGPGAGDAAASGTCPEIPEETAGPFPGDGSNGPNVLTQSGVIRSDIRPSFGGATGTADGVPLKVTLTLVDGACTALSGYSVYLWHCDAAGRYSLYSAGAKDENYLRGLQESDGDGELTFLTIFPGCYPGRWPHMHFEVFASLAAAASGEGPVATSQLALPQAPCEEVYATGGYSGSARNLAVLSLKKDSVFKDGAASQLASVTGSVAAGYVATLTVGVGG